MKVSRLNNIGQELRKCSTHATSPRLAPLRCSGCASIDSKLLSPQHSEAPSGDRKCCRGAGYCFSQSGAGALSLFSATLIIWWTGRSTRCSSAVPPNTGHLIGAGCEPVHIWRRCGAINLVHKSETCHADLRGLASKVNLARRLRQALGCACREAATRATPKVFHLDQLHPERSSGLRIADASGQPSAGPSSQPGRPQLLRPATGGHLRPGHSDRRVRLLAVPGGGAGGSRGLGGRFGSTVHVVQAGKKIELRPDDSWT